MASVVNEDYIANSIPRNEGKIKEACTKIETVAAYFDTQAKEIRNIKDRCNEKVMSFDGYTYQDNFEEIATEVNKKAQYLREYAEAIRNYLPKASAYQQGRINEYEAEKARAAQQAAQQSNNN